jgi:hypothetical protein
VEQWTKDLPLEVLIDMDRTAMQLRSHHSFTRLGTAVQRVFSRRLLPSGSDQASCASLVSLGSPQEEGKQSGDDSPSREGAHPSRQTADTSAAAVTVSSASRVEDLTLQDNTFGSTSGANGGQGPLLGWLSWLLIHNNVEGPCSNEGCSTTMSSPVLVAALAHL